MFRSASRAGHSWPSTTARSPACASSEGTGASGAQDTDGGGQEYGCGRPSAAGERRVDPQADLGSGTNHEFDERSRAIGLMSGIKVVEVASWTYVPVAGAVLAEWGPTSSRSSTRDRRPPARPGRFARLRLSGSVA
jgi:hypothetical protein